MTAKRFKENINTVIQNVDTIENIVKAGNIAIESALMAICVEASDRDRLILALNMISRKISDNYISPNTLSELRTCETLRKEYPVS
ncbi:hypothetical protein [Sulfobacillus thermosulfidooxidans]|uniref:hypothetical protein n=1 Tax=Sulfobacillus thermosulfidooxidans TaxID=28034 RepID=UPI0006B41958|nr:hypothetical protein [Sulfobacillus thermosulfidooxidans]